MKKIFVCGVLAITTSLALQTVLAQSAAPALPVPPVVSVTNSPTQAVSATAPSASASASTAKSKPKPKSEPPSQVLPGPDFKGELYIGHRYYEKKSGGWGWVKKPNEDWKQARWVTLKENPGRVVSPSRRSEKSKDDEWEYKLYGSFADYQAYDPQRDERIDIFILEGYETLGAAKSIKRKPGPVDRFKRARRSGASSRETHPILTGPDSDTF